MMPRLWSSASGHPLGGFEQDSRILFSVLVDRQSFICLSWTWSFSHWMLIPCPLSYRHLLGHVGQAGSFPHGSRTPKLVFLLLRVTFLLDLDGFPLLLGAWMGSLRAKMGTEGARVKEEVEQGRRKGTVPGHNSKNLGHLVCTQSGRWELALPFPWGFVGLASACATSVGAVSVFPGEFCT